MAPLRLSRMFVHTVLSYNRTPPSHVSPLSKSNFLLLPNPPKLGLMRPWCVQHCSGHGSHGIMVLVHLHRIIVTVVLRRFVVTH